MKLIFVKMLYNLAFALPQELPELGCEHKIKLP